MITTVESHSSIKEVISGDKSIIIKKSELPWIEKESEKVPLLLVVLQGTAEKPYYYGSAIFNDTLATAAIQSEKRTRITNNLFYSNIPSFVNGRLHSARPVDYERSSRKMFYFGNNGGQRSYFIPFGHIDDVPVIITVATCDKSTQIDVLKTLTTQSHKQIKQSARL